MNKTFRETRILFFSMLMGQLLIGGVFIFQVLSSSIDYTPSSSSLAKMLGLGLLFAGIGISYLLYANAKNKGSKLDGLANKIKHYRKWNITRWAFWEGPNLILAVLYFLTKDIFFLTFFAIGIGAFLMAMPSIRSFVRDYNLSRSEENALEK